MEQPVKQQDLTEEQIAVLARNRRKAKTRIREKIRKKYKAGLLAEHGRVCWYCGLDLTHRKATLDHIQPMCDKTNEAEKMQRENLAVACDLCNLAKANRPLPEFLEWLKHVRSSKFSSRFIVPTVAERIRKCLRKILNSLLIHLKKF